MADENKQPTDGGTENGGTTPAAPTFVGSSTFGPTTVYGKFTVDTTGSTEIPDGNIADGSKQAVTGGQLKTVKDAVDANKASIDDLKDNKITVGADSGTAKDLVAGAGAIAVKGSANISTAIADTGDITVSLKDDITVNNAVVNGDLTVNGATTTVTSENLVVKDNIITLNQGETGDGVAKGTSGIEIARGTQPTYQIVFDEADDSVKIGTADALKKVATEDFVTEKITETVNNGVTQLVTGDWKLAKNDANQFVITYKDQAVAIWNAPVETPAPENP